MSIFSKLFSIFLGCSNFYFYFFFYSLFFSFMNYFSPLIDLPFLFTSTQYQNKFSSALCQLGWKMLFQELLFVKGLASQIPWLVTGDFNLVRAYQEKSGKEGFSNYEHEFIDCLSCLEIEDLTASSCFHTWTNNQCGSLFPKSWIEPFKSGVASTLWQHYCGIFGEGSVGSFSNSCFCAAIH
jgi:hypothetical protein